MPVLLPTLAEFAEMDWRKKWHARRAIREYAEQIGVAVIEAPDLTAAEYGAAVRRHAQLIAALNPVDPDKALRHRQQLADALGWKDAA